MEKRFKVAVIVPIYNVEAYLEEALDSVIGQTMDFQRHIQLILINDGSTDGSEDICLRYAKKYPENILYRFKENGGVSSARNMGFDFVDAEYVTFLDPDDKWETGSFDAACRFLKKHREIDVLAARIKFFEAQTNYHALDYKFKDGSRVADLRKRENIYCAQSTAATCFIRASAIGDTRFDSRLKYGEDSTFINKLILKRCKLGLLREALYLYRRRATGNSAVNQQVFDKSFYLDSLKYYHLELFRYSKELYGEVIPYVQAMVGYDIMWRFANPEMVRVLNEEEQKEYFSLLGEILPQIEDEILINNPRHKTIARKLDAIRFKYGKDLLIESVYRPESGDLAFDNVRIFNVKSNKSPAVQTVNVAVKKGTLTVEVLVAKWLLACTEGGGEFFFKANGKALFCEEMTEYRAKEMKTSNGNEYNYNLLRFVYPLDGLKRGEVLSLVPYLRYGKDECDTCMHYGKFIPATIRFGTAYQFQGDYGIKCYRKKIDLYYPENKKSLQRQWDLKNMLCLLKRKRPDVLLSRYVKYPRFKKKEEKKGSIWLISDRIDNAGDNGEVLFKYICEHKPKGVRPIFVIGEMAKEEVKERLRGIGEVVLAEDKNYPYYFLMADKIISSSAGEFTINAFDSDRPYWTDLYHFTYYFMNHGVNCGDCSKWLNRFNKNIHNFFITGESERENIINRDYNYEPEQIIITGLARFDALYNDPKKQLLVLPTWRRAYRECYDEKTSSIYYEGFKDTDFFRFYNGLITDERLLSVMRKKGYRGIFCLHPIFAKQAAHFENSDVFEINEGFVDYNKAFAESAVMVTDYSTVAFDFAYLNKPIVYTQFDKEEFYENQIYDECFDYQNEGFGPICEDLDSAVEALCTLMENDCKNEYQHRIDQFFVYHDQQNAKRILEAVLADGESE